MTVQRHVTEHEQFFLADDGTKYRRIVGGIGWPGPSAYGFAVIIAEEYKEWPPLGRRRLFLLAEREARDVSSLLKMAADLQGEYDIQSSEWYGQATDNPMKSELDHFNRQSPYVYAQDAPDIEYPRVLEKYLRVLRGLLNPDQKTLILSTEENLLRDHHLPEIDEIDLRQAKVEDYPAIVALGAAVTALEYRPYENHAEYHKLREEWLDKNTVAGI